MGVGINPEGERIGHGVHIKDNEQAYSAVKDHTIALELCPTSNVQTKCVNAFDDHPIRQFHKDGVIVTINTDNRTVSDTDMTREVEKVFDTFELTKEDYRQIYMNSVDNAFASEEVKQHLRSFESDIINH
ncbi:Aminodeoxyfutalosine deaminase [Vibrio thalassae]|uniref:adenosine deaminase n=1 Tax=Vibrio thalassae TaxID=1243014 RepID=A0A240EQR7_9VIBR|nr:Aminodeoxyfutalosine deaminase [Vibrio thalassae]